VAGHRQRLRLKALAGDALAFLPALLFLALFSVGPVAVLLAGALAAPGGAAALGPLLADPLNVRAFQNSLEQGALSAAAAVALGYPAGVVFGRYAWRGRGAWLSVLLVPFLLPSLVVILGVRELFGPGGVVSSAVPWAAALGSGLPGVVAVNVYFNAPIVILFIAAAVENSARPLEDAATTLGAGPLRVFRDVWGRSSAAGAAAGALLTFVFSALGFAAPLVLCGARCSTLEVQVYELARVLLEPGAATLLAFVMVATLVAPTAAYLALLSRLRRGAASGTGRRARPLPWRDPVAWPLLAATGFAIAALMLLLAVVVGRAFAPSVPGAAIGSAFASLFSASTSARLGISTLAALGNTLFFAAGTAAVALLIGVATGFAARRRPRGARAVDFLLFVPLLLSPVLLAFALETFWAPVFSGPDSVWPLILLSQSSLALPFAVQSLNVSLGRVPKRYGEAARTLGASSPTAYLDAELPIARDGLVAATLFAFALGLGEFTATFFLFTPPFTTLPVELYILQGVRLVAPADALAGLLVVVSVLVFLAVVAGGRRVLL
jgi:thiamine transport system permease protein